MLNWYRVFVVVLVKNKGFISGNGGPTGRVIQISKKRVNRVEWLWNPLLCSMFLWSWQYTTFNSIPRILIWMRYLSRDGFERELHGADWGIWTLSHLKKSAAGCGSGIWAGIDLKKSAAGCRWGIWIGIDLNKCLRVGMGLGCLNGDGLKRVCVRLVRWRERKGCCQDI